MNFSRDDRGLSEVLGAMLVFALVISVLSAVQLAGVPAMNEQVEFEHNARVQEDMRELSSSVDRAAATGIDQPVDVETGVRYPPRLFLLNPGPTAGTLSTTGDSDVYFENLEALDSEAGQYLDSSNSPDAYTTTGLVYAPAYNEYNAPETRYEHGVLYNIDENGISVIDEGSLVTGNRITLTVIDGDIAQSAGDAVSFTLVPVSGPANVVSVTNATGDMTLRLETRLPESVWREQILADEISTGYVTDVTCLSGDGINTPCQLQITFEPDVNYEVRVSKVAVGGGNDKEPAAYLTKVGADAPAIQPGGTDLTVELRDAYNNPIRGETVNFRITGGFAQFPGGPTAVTDENGRATVTVDPIDNVSLSIQAFYDPEDIGPDNLDDAFTVNYDALPVADNTQPPTGDLANINPQDGTIVLTDVEFDGKDTVEATLENTDDAEWTLVRARISFVLSSGTPDEVDITNGGLDVATGFDVGGPMTDITNANFGAAGSGNEEVVLRMVFTPDLVDNNGNPYERLIIVSFEARNDSGETRYLTYFFA